MITAVPFAIFGAILAVWLAGLTNNVYFQVGLVTLVGLVSKNGILIVEFANQLRDRGVTVCATGSARSQEFLRSLQPDAQGRGLGREGAGGEPGEGEAGPAGFRFLAEAEGEADGTGGDGEHAQDQEDLFSVHMIGVRLGVGVN